MSKKDRLNLMTPVTLGIIAIMIFQIAGAYAQQLQHATGWGNINPRYMLTTLLSVGLFISIGLVGLGKFRHLVFGAILGLLSVYAIKNTYAILSADHRYSSIASDLGLVAKLHYFIEFNGFPIIFAYLFIAMLLTGVLLAINSVHKLGRLDND